MDLEIYTTIREAFDSKGESVLRAEYEEVAGDITAALLAAGYIRYDTIDLDPQKCVQLLAAILNSFKEDRPYVVVEKEEDDEDAQEDSTANSEASPKVI